MHVVMANVNVDLAQLNKGCNFIKQLVDAGSSQGWIKKLNKERVPMIEQLRTEKTAMDARYKECMKFYGETGNMEPEEFFSIWLRFVQNFDKAKAKMNQPAMPGLEKKPTSHVTWN